MCEMNPCRIRYLALGCRDSMVRYGTRSMTAGRSMGWWLIFWVVWGCNLLVATGHLWKLMWIFCTWIISLAIGVQKGRLDGKKLFLWGERLRAEVSGASVSPSHLVPWVPLCGVLWSWLFLVGLVLFPVGFFWYPGFCNHCMSSLHIRESLTDKATRSIGYCKEKNCGMSYKCRFLCSRICYGFFGSFSNAAAVQ